ncbi:two-component sensor histidine kinase [Nostoc carneum NIES-2107]|nr:two-component sensor histidine kinase [Nostoc carneum NIES-2107]
MYFSSQGNAILDRNDHYAVIQVEDTGIGIPQLELTRIFDRFYRVNSDRSRTTGGSGLGLAIAKAIVQTHHGSLDVQSELGKGSTFTIKLPFRIGDWGLGTGDKGREMRGQGEITNTNDK